MILAIAYILSLLHGLCVTRLLVKAGYSLFAVMAISVANSILVSAISVLTYLGLK